MKTITIIVLALIGTAGAALAQDDVTRQLPEGAMKPTNLSDLGSQMKTRVTDIVMGDEETQVDGTAAGGGLSLFAGGADEDPNILEIKKIARELDSQRALMKQIAELQSDLIEFAMADPAAAHKSRIPSSVCEYALKTDLCAAMDASFQPRRVISIEQ